MMQVYLTVSHWGLFELDNEDTNKMLVALGVIEECIYGPVLGLNAPDCDA